MMEKQLNKQKDDLPEVVVINESILTLQICVAIPPERIDEVPSKVFDLVGSPGTSHGRWELPDFIEHPESKPVECEQYDGRWHYLLVC